MQPHSIQFARPDQDGVRYRPLLALPFYCVGDDGSVWCCRSRFGRNHPVVPWSRRKTRLSQWGYWVLTIRRRRYFVHRLVLLAFVGPCPAGMEARHLDGDPTNNRLPNLCWGTPKENKQDSQRHGTAIRGSRVGGAKLTEAHIPLIRELASSGWLPRQIASRFGVHTTTINAVIWVHTWKHVP